MPCSIEVAALVDQAHTSAIGHRNRLLATKLCIDHARPEDCMSIIDVAGAEPVSVPYQLQMAVSAQQAWVTDGVYRLVDHSTREIDCMRRAEHLNNCWKAS